MINYNKLDEIEDNFSEDEEKNCSEHDLKFSSELLKEINILRTNPKSYISILQNDLKLLKDKVLYRKNEPKIKTEEGLAAYEEAIDYLRNIKPVPKMILKSRISKACRDHIDDIGIKGLYSHEGLNNISIIERIEKYCEWDYCCIQNIDFGSSTPKNLLIQFLTCDGDLTRSHRSNLFNPDLTYIGISSGNHKLEGIMTVLCYLGNYRKKGTSIEDIVTDIKASNEIKDNNFQIDDPDAPANTINVSLLKSIKMIDGISMKCTKKIYSLSDDTKHIVELLQEIV